MDNKPLNLHTDKKRALLIMLSFVILFLLCGILGFVSLNRDCFQLDSLGRSKYLYSGVAQKATPKDSYYQFNADIGFSLSADLDKSLRAYVIMQPEDTEYSRDVDWNTYKLGAHEIAISKTLARIYGLDIGDVLYSEHISKGTVCEYIVAQVIPGITRVKVSKTRDYHDGVIIMGFDRPYADNLSHISIVFESAQTDEVLEDSSAELENLLFRKDEITNVISHLLPYLILYLSLSIGITVAFVFVLSRDIRSNFRRLIFLGVEKNRLDYSLMWYIYSKALLSIIISGVISLAFMLVYFGYSLPGVLFQGVIMAVEIIALFSSVQSIKRHWWR